MNDHAFDAARAVILRGLEQRAFPAAVVNVGGREGVRWHESFGRLTYAEDAPSCQTSTIFDLASLTKVIATTSIAMSNIGAGRLALDTHVADVLPEWTSGDRGAISIRHLLDHSSGLPARVLGWKTTQGRDGFRRLIAGTPLERTPGAAAVYSDVDFMLLGLILEQVGSATLDQQLSQMFGHAIDPIQYRPMAHLYERIAPTEFDPWRGRVLCGEVHDENAAAMGGVSGHAGLFGTAEAVGTFARIVLNTFETPTVIGSPSLMRMFATRSTVPGSSRALGWDTALPTSSSGRRMGPGRSGTPALPARRCGLIPRMTSTRCC